MRAVPDVIAEEGEADTAPDQVSDQAPDMPAALMLVFRESDITDVVDSLFDMLADIFKSDHWKLRPEQAQRLGGPLAEILNASRSSISASLPDVLAKWMMETPGAVAFLFACATVVGPRIKDQMKISRERKQARPVAQPITGQHAQAAPARTGFIVEVPGGRA